MVEQTRPATAELAQAKPQSPRRTGRTIAIAVGAALLVAAMAAAGYGLVTHPPLAAVLRDITIIVLALTTVVIGALLGILIFQLQSLIALLRHDIKPFLDSANETASTVRGTTVFLSDAVVSPLIQAISMASAVRQVARAFVGKGHTKRSHREQQRENRGQAV